MKNKKKLYLYLVVWLVASMIHATARSGDPKVYPFRDASLSVEERVNDLIGRMTLEEKIDLLAGYRDFYLHPCERLGIPAFKLADGPLGLASWGLFGKATAFPASLLMAASWDTGLAARLGAMYAQEWRARGIHFLLAPGVNNYRASKDARNFEYLGEDPYLASCLVVPFIQGVQDGGVIATVKHFAANDQEFDRYTVSTEVSERALHEIYLPPFKAAVQKAGVKAVMTGYNLVNGVYCTENKYLIDLLKKEWGFQGMLMSDWACTYHAENAANHGLDLEMGSKDCFNRKQLLPLIRDGRVSQETIDDKVRRIYGTCISMGFLDRPQLDTSIPTFNPQANKLALEAAEGGIILLKNEHRLLPAGNPQTIAVIGPTATQTLVSDRLHEVSGIVYGGGGSSKVNPWYVVTDLEGIRREFPDATVLYQEGISNRFKSHLFRKGGFETKDGQNGLEAVYCKNPVSETPGHILSDKQLQQQAIAAGQVPQRTSGLLPETGENDFSDHRIVRKQVDRTVNFEWHGFPWGLKELGTDYKVCWEGYVVVERTDEMFFFVDAQGAYRLWIEDKLVLDAARSQSFAVGQAVLQATKGQRKHIRLEFDNQRSFPAEIRMGYAYKSDIDFSESLRLASRADLVVFCAGLDGAIEMEGRDRPFELPFGQDSLIVELAKTNPNIVVVVHAGGGVNMTRWIDQVPAVIHALYPGQEGGNALARILSGKVNPSAKLPFTIEKRWEDSPAYGNYDETRREKKIYYNEGIFTGYRGYEKKGVKPLFPFGFGMSYTTFEYSDLSVEVANKKEPQVYVSFTVKNTGTRSGKEIVQLYIHDIKSNEVRPFKELKGFEKIALAPGQARQVRIFLDREAFSYFHPTKKDWVVEPGAFQILVGASSDDIRLQQTIKL